MLIKKFSLSLISVIFLLILLELLIRFLPSTFIKFNLKRCAVSQEEVDFMNRCPGEPKRCLYGPSSIPGLGYELIPGAEAMRARVNFYGMTGYEYKIKKTPSTYRILLLGDSIIQEGFFAENLKRLLNDTYPQWSFEVWNAGVGGYQVNQYAAYLKYKGIKYNPDMVIVNLGLNDFDITNIIYYQTKDGVIAYYNFANQLSKVIPLNKWLFRHSRLYRFLISKAEALFLSSNTAESAVNAEAEEGKYYLEIIRDICQKNKAILLCTVFAYLKPLAEYKGFEKKSYKNIVDSLRDLDIEYIDLHKYFPEDDRQDLRFFKNDYVHLSPKGLEIAARAVFNYLVNNQLNEKFNIVNISGK